MALDGSALTTLQTVKDELGISTPGDDAILERYITTGSSLLVQAIGRDLHWREGVVEKVQSGGDTRLVVSDALPIDSIDSIVYDGGDTQVTEDSSRYRIEDAGAGFVEKTNGRWRSTEQARQSVTLIYQGRESYHYTVTYDGGWVTQEQADNDGTLTRSLPYDIEQAVIDYAVTKYRRKGRDLSVRSEKLGDTSVSYANSSATPGTANAGMPASFAAVVQRYQIPEIA